MIMLICPIASETGKGGGGGRAVYKTVPPPQLKLRVRTSNASWLFYFICIAVAHRANVMKSTSYPVISHPVCMLPIDCKREKVE